MGQVKPEGILYFIAAIFVNFGALLLNFLKVFFNLSFLATGFRLVFPKIVGFEDIKEVFSRALDNLIDFDINLKGLKTVFDAFVTAYSSIDQAWDQVDLAYRWRSENTCGGPIKWMQFIAILIFFGFFFYMTITDTLYVIIIKSHRVEKGKNKILAMIIKALLNATTTLVFYLLQVAAMVGLQMAFEGSTTGNSGTDPVCSESDVTTNIAARWFILIMLIILAIPSALLFGGGTKVWSRMKTDNGIAKLIGVIFVMLKHITFLTLGVWDADNLETYQIKEKAQTYDDDPDDNDSKQEAVIEIVARTRGLFWILFPGTIFLAKVTEVMNSSVIFSKLIEFKDGLAKRIILWILHIIQLAVTIVLIFAPGVAATVVLFLSVLFQFFVHLFVDCAKAISIFLNTDKKSGIV